MLITPWPRRVQLPLKLIFLVILSLVVFGEVQLYQKSVGVGVGVGKGSEPGLFRPDESSLPPLKGISSVPVPTQPTGGPLYSSSGLKAQQSEGSSVYNVQTDEGSSGTGAEPSFKAYNPAQHLELRFERGGVYVAMDGDKAEMGWRMHLNSVGYFPATATGHYRGYHH